MREILFRILSKPEYEFGLSELAKSAGVSKSTVSRLLPSLQAYDIVSIDEKGKVFRIKANLGSFEFRWHKIVYNLEFLFESGLVQYLEKIFKTAKAIVLFGSYRKGEDISTSDVDIAVETVESIRLKFVRPQGLEKYEKHFAGRKVQIMLFNRKNIDINLFNNIANGIVLSGFLEVRQ